MITWGRVLIVDDSTVYSQLMQTVLTPYCVSILTAATPQEGIALIEKHPGIELVLCDYVMDGGGGPAVLEYVQSIPEPKPNVVIVTGFRSEEVAEQVRQLGAVDCLLKPTTVRQIIQSLKNAEFVERRQFNTRWRCGSKAHLLDGESGVVIWDIYNISRTGAFLETKGPVPVGSEMKLRLELRGCKIDVRARVVRIQEPTWMDVGGVGVEFVDLEDDAEAAILNAIEFAEPEPS